MQKQDCSEQLVISLKTVHPITPFNSRKSRPVL
uniref:Uncharacterized protein n=1 Tax=Arundo donax TaxID=35708 RepID=A0A0A9BMI5_ARUDO